MIVGLDIGYGYTKVACSTGRMFKFKTLVTKYIPQNIFPDDRQLLINVNGVKYIVGEDAGDIIGDFTVGEDFVGTDEYYAIIGKVLSEIKEKVRLLVLGLPPGLYTEQRTKYLIRGLLSTIMSTSEGDRIITPDEVIYIPQGSGIYFHYVLSNGLKNQGDTVVVDVGHYTVDMVCFSSTGRFINDAARSYPLGNKILFDKVREHFSRQYGTFVSDELVEQLIRNKSITHFGTVYNFDADQIVANYYQDQLMRAVKEYAALLKQHRRAVSHIVLGGGGIVWAKNIQGAEIVDNPQMANAIGYMKYGKLKLGQS